MPAENRTLTAQWNVMDYDISYYLEGGTNHQDNPSSYTIEDEEIILKDPIKTGFTFLGWYSDDSFETEVTAIESGCTGDVVLYAKWGADSFDIDLRVFTIVYELGGGENHPDNPSSYTRFDETIVLGDASGAAEGYSFGGWYSDAELTEEITEIPEGSTGSMTLYVKWSPNSYQLSFAANSGTGTMGSVTRYMDEEAALPGNTFTKDGYIFAAWNTEADGSGESYADEASFTIGAGNVTLYAQWAHFIIIIE